MSRQDVEYYGITWLHIEGMIISQDGSVCEQEGTYLGSVCEQEGTYRETDNYISPARHYIALRRGQIMDVC